MADALCGPSNALQNFQKHTSVDRTLQQDRLVGRHSPSQGFRSSHGANAGALDSEFEAFQAGHAGPSQLQQPDFHHLPSHLARAPQPTPQFAQAPGAPDWASDFQRLNITNEHAPGILQHRASPAAASWQQDFMKHQAPAVQAPTFQQQSGFGGMSGYGTGRFGGTPFQQPMGFGGMNGGMAGQVAQGQQRTQEAVPQIDEAAFEQAFAQMDQHLVEEATTQQEQTKETPLTAEDDPALTRIREQRPAVYHTLKIRSAVDIGNAMDFSEHLAMLEDMAQDNTIVADASEARWIVDALQNMLDRSASQDVKTRAETLVRAINERLMSTYPLLSSRTMPLNQENIWEELQAAGYIRGPVLEHLQQQRQQEQQQQPESEQQEDQALRNDDDEMADTAGRLLERVADNTSEKFQNSQFLTLMRKLRDREVKVEGDKMVEVSAQSSSTQPPQQHTDPLSAIPPIDPAILDHASTDFAMPVFSEEAAAAEDQYAHPHPHLHFPSRSRRTSTDEPRTDEISDQFSYYNVDGAYHK
ncbi:hypothetical protein K458DRAFT_298011 [Lentithecium fluviatile CBS 122367]|uniref:Uncharacterized protein n=1 Tax=Lentithecium fluviatile CBS 122367 TaxID=1168545 RepID=A0A6G1J7P1_9PLEO|nr:hypothetical protein K458DRAFT_298011 [Lentithecium fluviatile CBS 122367]